MNVKAINNVQPRNSFKSNNDPNYYIGQNDTIKSIKETNINSENIKNPLEIVGSLALISVATFVSGALAAGFVSQVMPKLPVATEKALKGVAKKTGEFSKNIVENPTKKLDKATNFVKKQTGKAVDGLKNIYKNAIGRGLQEIPKDAAAETIEKIAQSNANKQFQRLGGVIATGSLLPPILKRDKDGNGISDIVEKTQKRSNEINKKIGNFEANAIATSQLLKMI